MTIWNVQWEVNSWMRLWMGITNEVHNDLKLNKQNSGAIYSRKHNHYFRELKNGSKQLSPLKEARRWARWGRDPSQADSYPRQRRRSQRERTGCVMERRAGSRLRSERGEAANCVRDARPSPETGGWRHYWRKARRWEGREWARSEM